MFKKLLLTLAILTSTLFIPGVVNAQPIVKPSNGGTGISSASVGDIGSCLKVATVTSLSFTYSLQSCASSGGSSGGTFSTTTSSVAGRLINYPNNTTDIVNIGSNSTTTGNFWFDPNTSKSWLVNASSTLFSANTGYFNNVLATSTTATSTFSGHTNTGSATQIYNPDIVSNFMGSISMWNNMLIHVPPQSVVATSSDISYRQNRNWSMYIGDGGQLSTTTTSTLNPVDVLVFEMNGTLNGALNTFVGQSAGLKNVSGNFNTFVGARAGEENVNGDQNAFFGGVAGWKTTSGWHDTCLGVAACEQNTTGYLNTRVGSDNGQSASTGHDNTSVGSNADGVDNGNYNASMGSGVLGSHISGDRMTVIGTSGARLDAYGQDVTSVGYSALEYNGSATSTVAIGTYAGRGSDSTGASGSKDNVFLGYASDYTNTTGSENTCLGFQSCYNLTSGSYNIAIGQNSDLASPTGSNQLNIGNVIYGKNMSNSGSATALPNISGLIAIGTTTPISKLEVWGTGTNANTQNLLLVNSASSTVLEALDNGSLSVGSTTSPGSNNAFEVWSHQTGESAGPFKVNGSTVTVGGLNAVANGLLEGRNRVGTLAYHFESAANGSAYFTNNLKVGVGTTTPGTPLGVTGAGVFTGTVTAPNFNATSTTNSTGTSTFAGSVQIGNSLFNGQFAPSGFFNSTGYPQLQVSANVDDGLGLVTIGNKGTGAYSAGCATFFNSNTPFSGGVFAEYNANICYTGPNFSAFPGVQPNGLAIYNASGGTVMGALSSNYASSSVALFSGAGYTTGNLDFVLSTLNPAFYPNSYGYANIGLGSTTASARLVITSSSTNSIPFFHIASSTNGTNSTVGTVPQETVFIVDSPTRNGRVGIGTTTPGSKLSIGNTGNNTINISETATSTFGSGINILTGCFAINGTCLSTTGGGGSGSGTVNSGTTGQTAYYASAGTAVSGTSTVFIATNSNVGIASTTPWGNLSVSAFGSAAGTPSFAVASSSGSLATTTQFIVVNDNVGVGTTSPSATFSINPVAGKAANQFAVGSSTAAAFLINNSGQSMINTTVADTSTNLTINGLTSAAFTSKFISMRNTVNQSNGIVLQEASNGASGRVGIQLESLGAAASIGISKYGAGASGNTWGFANFGVSQILASDNFLLGTSGATPLVLGTSNAEKARLTSAGLFSLGSTTPYAGLTVGFHNNSAPNLLVIATSSTAFATSTAIMVNRFASVGIGTSTPMASSTLEIVASINNGGAATTTVIMGSSSKKGCMIWYGEAGEINYVTIQGGAFRVSTTQDCR